MAPKKKSKEMKHSKIICLKLSDIELEILNHAASVGKFSRSEYLRNLIVDHKITIHYEVVIEAKQEKCSSDSTVKSAPILIRSPSILTPVERTPRL